MKKLVKDFLKKYNLIQYYQTFEEIRKQKKINELIKIDLDNFKKSSRENNRRFDLDNLQFWPILTDRTETTVFDSHYIYHPAWAARILATTKPQKHIDISSTLHFCSIISAFIPTEFYDYRVANLNLSNLISKHGDLLNLPFSDNSIASLSCMHTLEHIGLGRYGDQIDYDGDLKAADELIRVLQPNGTLLIVVPVGVSKIAFNAHRVYSYNQVMAMFSALQLMQFSLVPDNHDELGFMIDADPVVANQQTFGCGCFWFKKLSQ